MSLMMEFGFTSSEIFKMKYTYVLKIVNRLLLNCIQLKLKF